VARVLCPKHGPQMTSAVCPHVLAAVIAGGRVGALFPWRVDFEGQRLGPLWFCQDCARSHGIPAEGLLSSGGNGLDRWWGSNWQPVCEVCFREAGGSD
jgi:hypothetical protein